MTLGESDPPEGGDVAAAEDSRTPLNRYRPQEACRVQSRALKARLMTHGTRSFIGKNRSGFMP